MDIELNLDLRDWGIEWATTTTTITTAITDAQNNNEFIYDFSFNQKDKTKKIINASLSYAGPLFEYIRDFLDDIDSETADRFDLLTSKNIKDIFYRHNDLLLSKNLPTNLLKQTKVSEEKIVLEEVQNRNWQYLVKTLICYVGKKQHLKTLLKKESKMMKELKKMKKLQGELQFSLWRCGRTA